MPRLGEARRGCAFSTYSRVVLSARIYKSNMRATGALWQRLRPPCFRPAPVPQRGMKAVRAPDRLCACLSGRVRRRTRPGAQRLLLKAGRLARGGVVRGADVGDGVQTVLDDRVLDVLDGHRDGGQQLGLDLVTGAAGDLGVGQGLDVLALQQVDRELGGVVGLALVGLVDGGRLGAGDDPLDGRELGVLTGQRDGADARALEGVGDTTGHAVVGGVDARDVLGAQLGDGRGHLLRGDGVLPQAGLLVGDLDLAVEDLVRAFLELRGVRVGVVTVDHDDVRLGRRLGAEGVEQGLTLELADLDVVEGDVRGDRTLGQTVVRDDLDALAHRGGDGGLDGGRVLRRDHDDLDALGHHAAHLLGLLGRVGRGVGVGDGAVAAQLLDLVLEVRLVELLVPRRDVVGQEQTDRLAARARAAAVAAVVVTGLATSGGRDGERRDRDGYGHTTHERVHF